MQTGELLGNYKLVSRLGAGGMGEVWRTEDTRLGRMVAVKILPPRIASDPEMLARLRREARTAAQLNHPNIATIHSIEEAGGHLFIVMELVDGEPLSAMIARGPLVEAEVYRIARGVADALVEAHAKGIVHRDIKPDNILVSGSRVKVLDFGIAKRVGGEQLSSDNPTAFVTQEGMIVGTVHYMSPEQAIGKAIDARTDIFSLGVVMYQAATGKQPFGGETITETITQIIRDEPTPPRIVNPAISAGLASIIQRCMKKNKDERYATAADLAATLAAGPTAEYTKRAAAPTVKVAPPPVKGRSMWGWVIAAIVLLIGIGAAAMFMRNKPAPVKTASVVAPPPKPSTTTVEVAPPAATTNVATGLSPSHDGLKPVTTSAPPPEPATPTTTTGVSAVEHFDHGMTALLNHNMFNARNQFERALEHPDQLTQRQREFARLGLAISSGDRQQAQRIGQHIESQNPGDPDLQRIKDAMAEQQKRRPWRGRNH